MFIVYKLISSNTPYYYLGIIQKSTPISRRLHSFIYQYYQYNNGTLKKLNPAFYVIDHDDINMVVIAELETKQQCKDFIKTFNEDNNNMKNLKPVELTKKLTKVKTQLVKKLTEEEKKQKSREYHREYYEKHPDIKEKYITYYQENAEKIKANAREKYKTNKQIIEEYNKLKNTIV